MESATEQGLLERAVGDNYEIIRLLGRGGMGAVFLARERLLERQVAIKVLRSELVHADGRERFIREARTAAKLTHPHIVPMYSFGQAGDTLYYIMGFVDGESLEDRLKRQQRLAPGDARRVLAELASALEYAHGNGVVHRDIKPDNVMIERGSSRAILTDFGIAKISAGGTQITRTGMIVGTPLYMSPEQAAGEKDVDGRSDLYSLGVIGYRMLNGRVPFEGDSIQEVFVRQAANAPAPIDPRGGQVPPSLIEAVMRCLQKDPVNRWPTAAVFQRALLEVERPPGGSDPPLLALIRKWFKGNRQKGLSDPVRVSNPALAIDNPDSDQYSAATPIHLGMFDHIDPRSPTPLYAQIATRIRVGIAAGELEPGEALPSVRSLAAQLRINPATVVQAYRDLESEGLVSTRHGSGTFVQQVGADRRKRDRSAEARRLVRELLSQAGTLGITAAELRSAVDEELNGGKR
jgi:serine/threonine protein kinase